MEKISTTIKRDKWQTTFQALAEVDAKQLGMAIYDLDTKQLIKGGDADVRFAIESMSKVPVLLLAIKDNGIEKVFQTINTEPTGFAFNSIIDMEINHRKHPMNPFVNAGAIATTSLIAGKDADEKFERIISFMKEICDDPDITLNGVLILNQEQVISIALFAYYMKGNQMIEGDVPEILDAYFRQCSVECHRYRYSKISCCIGK